MKQRKEIQDKVFNSNNNIVAFRVKRLWHCSVLNNVRESQRQPALCSTSLTVSVTLEKWFSKHCCCVFVAFFSTVIAGQSSYNRDAQECFVFSEAWTAQLGEDYQTFVGRPTSP